MSDMNLYKCKKFGLYTYVFCIRSNQKLHSNTSFVHFLKTEKLLNILSTYKIINSNSQVSKNAAIYCMNFGDYTQCYVHVAIYRILCGCTKVIKCALTFHTAQ